MKKIILLGSTGSIGTQCIDVLQALRDEFQVVGLSARHSGELLLKQAQTLGVGRIALTDEAEAQRVQADLPGGVKLFAGPQGLLGMCRELAGQADMAVVAIVGVAGLNAVVTCIQSGMDIALANKETLVAGGALVNRLLQDHGRHMVPVDSEHSAIFQCLQGVPERSMVKRIILTASGGPFVGYSAEQLRNVTPQQALKHPNWSMGSKITIDSASMMNKALEVIEARWLFALPPERIDVVVHRQSVVHSMVELVDNSVLAQMGEPDMRIPIQYALTYPKRVTGIAPALDLVKRGTLTFESVDMECFRGLKLAYEALRMGKGKAVALNAANEVAVQQFLQGEIAFDGIFDLAERILEAAPEIDELDLGKILELDRYCRSLALRR